MLNIKMFQEKHIHYTSLNIQACKIKIHGKYIFNTNIIIKS
jgi:hypothetical protein